MTAAGSLSSSHQMISATILSPLESTQCDLTGTFSFAISFSDVFYVKLAATGPISGGKKKLELNRQVCEEFGKIQI